MHDCMFFNFFQVLLKVIWTMNRKSPEHYWTTKHRRKGVKITIERTKIGGSKDIDFLFSSSFSVIRKIVVSQTKKKKNFIKLNACMWAWVYSVHK